MENKAYWADYLNNKLERLQGYHNHKENMVNAGFLVQLTLFSTIIMRNIWPPQWMAGLEMVSGLSTLIVYFIFWMLIHNFIGWQLQNKRVSSLFINGYDKALNALLFANPNILDTDLQQEQIKPRVPLWAKWMGSVFPLKRITINYDMSPEGLPNFITKELQVSFANSTGAMFHEKLLMLGSLLMLVLSALRMVSFIFY